MRLRLPGLPDTVSPGAFSIYGIALTVCADEFLASELVAARLLGQIVDAAAARVPVALRIDDRGEGPEASERLRRVCDRLDRAFRHAGADASGLEITVDAHTHHPRAAWQIRGTALGAGTLNIVLGERHMQAATRQDARVWRQVWQLRSSRVVVACCPSITSRCSLLPPERATDVIPRLGLQAPEQTAWLSSTLDLYCFSDASGGLDLAAIERSLCRGIDAAEAGYDLVMWPTPRMQQDAWLNRRLAIRVVGIGDIVEKRGLDPRSHATTVELDSLLLHIRRAAERRSQQIAQSSETLPAISAGKPCTRLHRTVAQQDWEARWLRAIRKSAQRHRNLIVMSPWSLFPRTGADFCYSNLLPLLSHADACEFHRHISVDHWKLDEFVSFHRRIWAVRQRTESAMAVAEQL